MVKLQSNQVQNVGKKTPTQVVQNLGKKFGVMSSGSMPQMPPPPQPEKSPIER